MQITYPYLPITVALVAPILRLQPKILVQLIMLKTPGTIGIITDQMTVANKLVFVDYQPIKAHRASGVN